MPALSLVFSQLSQCYIPTRSNGTSKTDFVTCPRNPSCVYLSSLAYQMTVQRNATSIRERCACNRNLNSNLHKSHGS
jgi:hypothetical protein